MDQIFEPDTADVVMFVRRNDLCVSACKIGSDSYVERPGWQGVFASVELRGTVQSYVRPLIAGINRWP